MIYLALAEAQLKDQETSFASGPHESGSHWQGCMVVPDELGRRKDAPGSPFRYIHSMTLEYHKGKVWEPSFFVCILYLHLFIASMCGHTFANAYLRRSGDNLQDSILSFYQVGPGSWVLRSSSELVRVLTCKPSH